ncbi:trafficking protein particle complex subunit 13-like [Dysidea avara]|uniref:trafficking protein particle complex subunit 13-like n=1 Tax=Dysidea avara TaxID=196820 RepID=UPI00331E1416
MEQVARVERQHLLSLKVMRLTKPTMATTHHPYMEPWDISGDVLQRQMVDDPRTVEDIPRLAQGEFLLLPQNFGVIFLGETFKGFILVSNNSTEQVKDVTLKTELSAAKGRTVLPPVTVSNMDPNGRLEHIITHEMKELGDHTLICNVTYIINSTGEEMFFRRVFKFDVGKPLDVKTKFHNLEEKDILMEVQIQNLMPFPMCMNQVSFEPSSVCTSTNLNSFSDSSGERQSLFGKEQYVKPGDIRRYLYRITPNALPPSPTSKTTASIVVGKMDVMWFSRFGERGRIQTGPLQTSVPIVTDLKVVVISSPGDVTLEEPFQITCLVTNTSPRPMKLRSMLVRNPGAGVLWSGVTGQYHRELVPHSSAELTFDLLPILPGLQAISMLCFQDMLTNQRYPFHKLCQVFVNKSST